MHPQDKEKKLPLKGETDTLFSWAMRDTPAGIYCGYNYEEPTNIAPIVKYCLGHAIGFTIFIAWSYVSYLNFWVHSCIAVILFTYATWNGATRYFRMMTVYYVRHMKKLVDESNPNKNKV